MVAHAVVIIIICILVVPAVNFIGMADNYDPFAFQMQVVSFIVAMLLFIGLVVFGGIITIQFVLMGRLLYYALKERKSPIISN